MNSRRARGRQRSKSEEVVEYGSGIVGPSRAAVRAAVEGLSLDAPWEQVRASLRPIFIRRRPLPPGIERPLTLMRPPGVEIALGVDVGPAFMYVGRGMLDSWAVSVEKAFDTATDNLRELVTAERYVEMEYETIDGVPFWWYQSQGGLASGLLLLERELASRYGDQPRLLIAPMRNLLIAAPFEADREIVAWVRDQISSEDPNGLDLPIFALLEGRLSIDERRRGGVPVLH
jgi:hypothetical protein